uniref:Putative rep protein n=1 Tax=uncultured virus TaxID=340016 RepID=A0A1D8MJZ3_9VIRU|nr:putative rep protein [uncultured virus]
MPPRKRALSDSDSDVEEIPPPDSAGEQAALGEPAQERKFRFCARAAFLTYPRCPILPEQYRESTTFDWQLVKLCFAKQERHHSGETHLHVYLRFTRKLDVSNCRYFDASHLSEGDVGVVGYHPNVRNERGKGSVVRVWEYLCKDGGVQPVDLVGTTELYPSSKNFRKEYGDRITWLNYHATANQPRPEYPLPLPDGKELDRPTGADKKRHLWIWGPPNAGKTLWLERAVYRYRNYKIADAKYPFDNYTNEELVVWDDMCPKASILLNLCNFSAYPRPVPGETRYHRRNIPGGTVVIAIVCINMDIATAYSQEHQSVIDAIKARFIEIHLLGQDD